MSRKLNFDSLILVQRRGSPAESVGEKRSKSPELYSLGDSETPSNFIAIRVNFATIGTSLYSRSIKDKSISGEKVLRQNCLDSITSTSTVALSTSTIFSLFARTSCMPERVQQSVAGVVSPAMIDFTPKSSSRCKTRFLGSSNPKQA